jgi:hypothetical protein
MRCQRSKSQIYKEVPIKTSTLSHLSFDRKMITKSDNSLMMGTNLHAVIEDTSHSITSSQDTHNQHPPNSKQEFPHQDFHMSLLNPIDLSDGNQMNSRSNASKSQFLIDDSTIRQSEQGGPDSVIHMPA